MKEKSKKIPKQKTVKQLVKQLDSVFSKFVRLSNADENGVCRCCTCGNPMEWKYIQNGHYISRKFMAVRWDEKNCGPQCTYCNIFSQGEQVKFRAYLVKKYGEDAISKMELKKTNRMKLEPFYLSVMINEYEQKLKSFSLLKVNQQNCDVCKGSGMVGGISCGNCNGLGKL